MVALAACDPRVSPATSAVLTTLIATGIRTGECLGLRWSDIDLDARTAHVRRVLSRTRKRGDAPTSFLVESTKTASSNRIVNLGPSAVAALRRWRVAQAELRMKAPTEPLGWGLGRCPDDLVFTGPRGQALDASRLGQMLRGVTQEIGDWHPHALRHSAASLMLGAGVPITTVSRSLGHSSITMTLDVYGHLVSGEERAAADALDAVLTSGRPALAQRAVIDQETLYGSYIDPVFENTCNTPNPDLAPEGEPLTQTQMKDCLDDLVIEAVAPSVTITDAPAATTTATEATFGWDTDGSKELCVLDGGAIKACTSAKTYSGLAPGEHTFRVIAEGKLASDTHTRTVILPGEDTIITPLTPVRYADARPGWVAADKLFYGTGPVPTGVVVQVQIAGRGAVPVGAKAVVANVTLVNAAAAGFATVFPCGTVPDASTANYRGVTNEAVANEVIAELSPTGSICVYTNAAANVLVDVVGHL